MATRAADGPLQRVWELGCLENQGKALVEEGFVEADCIKLSR